MRKLLTIAVLLCCGTYAFAAPKSSVKQSSESSGMLIVSGFIFNVQGDGISTTMILTPPNVPQANPLPTLPIVGMIGTGTCNGGEGITFTAERTPQRGQFKLTFSVPLAQGQVFGCVANLLFQPQ